MTGPIFQQPGQTARQPTGRTGTCNTCGREDVPIVARKIAGHTELHIKGRTSAGLPNYVDSGQPCDGAGQPPEPGTETRPPKQAAKQPTKRTRPWRGKAMPQARREAFMRRDGAA